MVVYAKTTQEGESELEWSSDETSRLVEGREEYLQVQRRVQAGLGLNMMGPHLLTWH
jgi:hypothetical protein